MTVPARSHRSPLAVVLILLAALALAAAGWWLLARTADTAEQGAPRATAPPPAPVVVSPAGAARDDVVVEVVGSALAADAITVHPAVPGEVARILFVPGQRVRQGQALVQLVDRNERLAVERARAQVDAAARLLKRYESTRGTGAVSASVIDEARLALRQAEIELAQAREQLSDRTVRAAFDGVVGIGQVDPGSRVTPDTALTTLDNRRLLSLSFQVPEPFLARLQRGQQVSLRNVAYPERAFSGVVAHVDSRVDPATRTVNLRATVPNEQDLLRPGMAFTVRLSLPGAAVLRVPELAVQWGREGSHVWVVRDDVAERVPVRVVRRMEGAVLVDGALRAGEAIVVEGFHRLRPARAVRVVEERPFAAAQPTEGAQR